ncbi:MAG TPA: dienelactone hydrolase family protein [Thermoanaerobaculia bacterium]|jgi:predicted esterase|nr:dienelactone hydrolase family protein [Thermoanaerobaculia bacterium]
MNGPHQGQPLARAGRPVEEASGAVVMVHGRGATAESILELRHEFENPDLAYVAPQAAGYAWYPYSFMAPMERNEPGLSSALARLGEVLAGLEAAGIPPERTILLGFSQGACLALEFAARNARRYAAVVGLSGGLIGPPGTPRDYLGMSGMPGSFEGTPVFLGCSDRDPHIPRERVEESAEVLRRMGAEVTERIYPAMGHTVNEDEMEFVRGLVAGVTGAA